MQQSLGLSHNASPDSNNGCKEDHGNQDTKAKGKTNLAGPHQSKIIKKKKKERKQTETNLQQNGSSGHSFRQIRIFAIFTIVKQFRVF